jgi:SAM-dependent methyltransferase
METKETPQGVMESRYNLPYNWLYKASGRHWRGKNGLWKIASGLAGDIKGKHVLDAGCGDGWYSARMIKAGANVSGIDLSPRAVAFAQQILPDGAFTSGSLTKLPYPDKTFDRIFSFQVLEHIPLDEYPRAIEELKRVLKDDGRCIISVPSVNRPLSRAHFRHFTEKTFVGSLEGMLEVERVIGQEKRGVFLWMIERLVENRIWLLPAIAEWFHKGIYLRYFNHASPERGANLVVLVRK